MICVAMQQHMHMMAALLSWADQSQTKSCSSWHRTAAASSAFVCHARLALHGWMGHWRHVFYHISAINMLHPISEHGVCGISNLLQPASMMLILSCSAGAPG